MRLWESLWEVAAEVGDKDSKLFGQGPWGGASWIATCEVLDPQ